MCRRYHGPLFYHLLTLCNVTAAALTFAFPNARAPLSGNSALNVGYSCKQRELVKGWRAIWSETPNTTDPNAPFGLVTLASSGSEGGPNMGAMRLAQTAGYGVLPNDAVPHSFLAQAGDLEDVWGPAVGPCFSGFASQWECCDKGSYTANRSSATCQAGTHGKPEICDPACAAAAGTPSEGGIHPRSKLPVGERLATGAYNLVYGGVGAFTGPTLSGCTVDTTSLTINFNQTLLRGDKVSLNSYNSALNNPTPDPPPVPSSLVPCYNEVKSVCAAHLHNITDCRNCKNDPSAWAKLQTACSGRPINNFHTACKSFFPDTVPLRGSLLEVLVGVGGEDASAAFCVEPMLNSTTMREYCPPWAGPPDAGGVGYNSAAGKWFQVDIVSATASSVTADLSKLNGSVPAAVRYSWGIYDCCNTDDPSLYIGKPCDADCPITSSTAPRLPANPFIAKLIHGKCSCVTPQAC
jgi:hypothetical protein